MYIHSDSLIKNNTLAIRFKSTIQSFIEETSTLMDDILYKSNFIKRTAVDIYKSHVDSSYRACAFCKHLHRSGYRKQHFTCINKPDVTYSSILPVELSFYDAGSQKGSENSSPLLFKRGCRRFKRLPLKQYLKNFTANSSSNTTVGHMELLEGVFTGMSRGYRPCYICASVSLNIYDQCSKSRANMCTDPCSSIFSNLSEHYKGISFAESHNTDAYIRPTFYKLIYTRAAAANTGWNSQDRTATQINMY